MKAERNNALYAELKEILKLTKKVEFAFWRKTV